MSLQGTQCLALSLLRFPQAHCAIHASTGKGVAVWVKSDTRNFIVMSMQRLEGNPARDFPQTDGLVIAPAHQYFAIMPKGEGRDGGAMTVKSPGNFLRLKSLWPGFWLQLRQQI